MEENQNIAERILNKDIQNIVKKVAEGKTLSAAERRRIEEAYGETPSPKYAKNVVELAQILQVNRKTINRWRKSKSAPEPLSNGYHDVQAWKIFVRAHDLKTPDTPEEEALKVRKLLAEVQQAELKLATLKKEFVSIEEVRQVWTWHIGQVRAVLESRLLNELPPLLLGLDAIQIREKMQNVLDEVYANIQATVKPEVSAQ